MPTLGPGRLLAALALALILPACSGGATLDEAIDGLQVRFDAREFEAVVTDAEALLARCTAESADAAKTWRVERLAVSALARQGQGNAAAERLERLAPTYTAQINAKFYNQIAGYVEEAGNLTEAVSVCDAGAKRFPQNAPEFMPRIESLKERALASGDEATIAHLKSLGYL